MVLKIQVTASPFNLYAKLITKRFLQEIPVNEDITYIILHNAVLFTLNKEGSIFSRFVV